MSVVSLEELTVEQVARNILKGRVCPSSSRTFVVPEPDSNKVFACAMNRWSIIESAAESKKVKALEVLATLPITEADFGQKSIRRRDFVMLQKMTLTSLVIGYERNVVDGLENDGDDTCELNMVQLLEHMASAETRQTLIHLNVMRASVHRFTEHWAQGVANLFPNLQSLNLVGYHDDVYRDLANAFPNLKSLNLRKKGNFNAITGVGLLRNLEVLMIESITDEENVEELFQLQKLRVLSVPGTRHVNRPFIYLFRECLDRGLTFPELQYFDCSEMSIDIPYDAIVQALPKLEHFTCIGSSTYLGYLPSYNVESVRSTIEAIEHYLRLKNDGMLLMVLYANQMADFREGIPQCAPHELRTFIALIYKLIERKPTGLTTGTLVCCNCPKILKLMIASRTFSEAEVRRFVAFVLRLFRKFESSGVPHIDILRNVICETLTTPGIRGLLAPENYLEICRIGLRNFPNDYLRANIIDFLTDYCPPEDHTKLSGDDLKLAFKYLVESVYDRMDEPENEPAQHHIFDCLRIISHFVALSAFAEPDNIEAGDYSKEMSMFLLQMISRPQFGRWLHRGMIKFKVLCIFRVMLCKRVHPPALYTSFAVNIFEQTIKNPADNLPHSMSCAGSILAKLLLFPEQFEGGMEVADGLNETLLHLCRSFSSLADPPKLLELDKARDEIESAQFMGTVTEHVCAIHQSVRYEPNGPQHFFDAGLEEIMRKLSRGEWKHQHVDECVVRMAKEIRDVTEPGWERGEKRRAEDEQKRTKKSRN
ncbi:unnamed protein product [Caenorhabditis sp. 36 PRJEB53466]|nr:unnamed protein product [Caenorhabditis sp. 36 PRJEB53466]